MCSEAGVPASSSAEVDQLWQQHFCKLMAGEPFQDEKDCIEQFWATAPLDRPTEMPLDLRLAPTPSVWQAQLCKGRAASAPGPDGIGNALLKVAPHQFHAMSMPIAVKASLRCEEPLQWRGGSMATFPKNKKKAATAAKDHRGVLLANCLAKKLHSHWRASLDACIAPQLRDDMLGGFKGRAADFASHSVSL